jgi:hypothetical protein
MISSRNDALDSPQSGAAVKPSGRAKRKAGETSLARLRNNGNGYYGSV